MPFFLFAKQIVDMLYQYQFLDYGMVLLAMILLGYKIWKDKLYKDIKANIISTDVFVIALGILYVLSFLRYPSLYGTFFKVESCFLIYFLGRVYAKEIMNHGRFLAYAGYIVVYANFVYRFYQFGWKFIVTGPEETLLNAGGLYYYKTDLAFGLLVACLFIYLFGRNKICKWFTIIVVAGYLVFYSGARMGQVVMLGLYAFIFLREYANWKKCTIGISSRCVSIIFYVIFVMVAVFFVAIQVFPFDILDQYFDYETEIGMKLEHLMHARHIIWCDVLQYFSEQDIITRMFGIDLGTEYMHTSVEIRAHSQYIKQIYSTGYIGCVLMLMLVKNVFSACCERVNEDLNFMVVVLWVAFLGFGLTIESLEATQMSWFPMMFLAVVVSKHKNGMLKE